MLRESYPEDTERDKVLLTFAQNEGMADFMWKVVTGQKRRVPFDEPTKAHYADFYMRYIRNRTPEELGTLLITIQDFMDAVPQYTEDDYAAADIAWEAPASMEQRERALY